MLRLPEHLAPSIVPGLPPRVVVADHRDRHQIEMALIHRSAFLASTLDILKRLPEEHALLIAATPEEIRRCDELLAALQSGR